MAMQASRLRCAGLCLACLFAAAVMGCGRRPDDSSITLIAGGDVLLDRGVARRIGGHGADYPFAGVAHLLRSADIACANLECPISTDGRPAPKPFSFRADASAATGLARSGLDVLCLANNHTLDCGRAGLSDTMAYLRAEGIAWCGAGIDGQHAVEPAVVVRKGLRIAFVGFCDLVQDAAYPRSDLPTVAQSSPEVVRRAVRNARAGSDIVVASFHWGREYVPRPTGRQRRIAAVAADAGADVILGHHPHILQGLEWMTGSRGRGALVAYSLGNLVFDPLRMPANRTMLLRVRLTRAGVAEAEVIPCVIEDCRPISAPRGAAAEILSCVTELSAELQTGLVGGRFTPTAVERPRRQRRDAGA